VSSAVIFWFQFDIDTVLRNIFDAEPSFYGELNAAEGSRSSMAIVKQQRLAKQATLAAHQSSPSQEETGSPPPATQSEVGNELPRPAPPPHLQGHRYSSLPQYSQDGPTSAHPTHHQPPNPTLDNYLPAGYLPSPYNSQRHFSDMSPQSQWIFHNPGGPPYMPNHTNQSMYQPTSPSNYVHPSELMGRGPPTSNTSHLQNEAGPSVRRNHRGSNASEFTR